MTILIATGNDVPTSFDTEQRTSWQQAMKEAIRDPHQLCHLLGLPDESVACHEEKEFPLFVPRSYLARMNPGDPTDPLLRQVLPVRDELNRRAGFSADPVGDTAAALHPGLLHKYQSRVLMVATGACAVHCRYCFRRHFPYSEVPKSPRSTVEGAQSIARNDPRASD